MNKDRIEGIWRQLSGLVKEQWGALTSDQSRVAAGRRERLAGQAQERGGIAKEVSRIQLKDFLYHHRDWNPSSR